MNLTAEQISENWDKLMSRIDAYISEPRRTKLKEFYQKYAERIMLMPAAHKKEYHNAFPGGYVEHVLRVIDSAIDINNIWIKYGVDTNTYTLEELVFSALNHDLGKMGDENNEAYIPQTDQWRKEKLGEDYKFNVILCLSINCFFKSSENLTTIFLIASISSLLNLHTKSKRFLNSGLKNSFNALSSSPNFS